MNASTIGGKIEAQIGTLAVRFMMYGCGASVSTTTIPAYKISCRSPQFRPRPKAACSSAANAVRNVSRARNQNRLGERSDAAVCRQSSILQEPSHNRLQTPNLRRRGRSGDAIHQVLAVPAPCHESSIGIGGSACPCLSQGAFGLHGSRGCAPKAAV